MRHCLDFSDS